MTLMYTQKHFIPRTKLYSFITSRHIPGTHFCGSLDTSAITNIGYKWLEESVTVTDPVIHCPCITHFLCFSSVETRDTHTTTIESQQVYTQDRQSLWQNFRVKIIQKLKYLFIRYQTAKMSTLSPRIVLPMAY